MKQQTLDDVLNSEAFEEAWYNYQLFSVDDENRWYIEQIKEEFLVDYIDDNNIDVEIE